MSPEEHIHTDYNDTSSLNDIRLQLSEHQEDFEQTERIEKLYTYLIDIYKTHTVYKEIFENYSLRDITRNSDIVNQLFLIYLKALPTKTFKFENIFITFCDFFNFGYDVIYKQLHQKIQLILKKRLIAYIGKKQYQKNEQKYITGDNIVITSIFDL